MANGNRAIARLVRTGFVWDHGKWSAEIQERILREAGVTKIIFHDPKLGITLETALKTLRGNEVLELAGGLRALGTSRYSIHGAMTKVKEERKVVMDCRTKRRSDTDGFEMLSDALAAIHGEMTAPNRDDAREWGANGAKARWAERQKKRMPYEKALAIWTDTKISNKQALRRMGSGWTMRTAYEVFGASGRRQGAAAHRKRKRKS